jgi:hypothetical protein
LVGDSNGPFDHVGHEPVFAQSVDGAADEFHFMFGRVASGGSGSASLCRPSQPRRLMIVLTLRGSCSMRATA